MKHSSDNLGTPRQDGGTKEDDCDDGNDGTKDPDGIPDFPPLRPAAKQRLRRLTALPSTVSVSSGPDDDCKDPRDNPTTTPVRADADAEQTGTL
eukprot:4739292-Alexandrium_andersonii.AAC.1